MWWTDCLKVWMFESLNVRKFECLKVWMPESLNVWKFEYLKVWTEKLMISYDFMFCLNVDMYPIFTRKRTHKTVSSQAPKHISFATNDEKMTRNILAIWPGTWTHPQSSDSCYFWGLANCFLASYAFNLPVLHEDLAVAVKKFLELYRNGQWPGCPASFLNLAALEIQSGSWRSPNVGRIYMVFHGMPASFQSKNWRT